MKKIIIGVFGFIILGGIGFILLKNSPKKDVDVPAPSDVSAALPHSESAAPQSSGYKIKEYKGNIAVFEAGQEQPFKTVSVCVKDLPKDDRELLRQGISVNSLEELSTVLEDYCS